MVYEPHKPLDAWGFLFYLSFPFIFVSLVTLNPVGILIGGIVCYLGYRNYKPVMFERQRRVIKLY